MSHPLIKVDQKHDGEVTEPVQKNHSQDRPILSAKMVPQSLKINPRSIFTRDVNFTTTKTVIDAISSKSGDFNKMAEKKF